MKMARMISVAVAAVNSLLSLFFIFPTSILAADAARVAGDLKVDGIHFTTDGSFIRKLSDLSSPWTTSNLDIYFLGGKVGIGKLVPTTELDVNGTVNATQFSGNGTGLTNVTASSVTDGSITDAKVSGVISSAKLDLSTVQQKYGKVAVVAQSGGDYSSPVAAMTGIAAWCGVPSASNPCLMKITPGVYNLGTSSLTMQQYVDIEGSGENVTRIKGNITDSSLGVVNGVDNAELRFLTVENTGGGSYSSAINNLSASPKITNVTAIASGGTLNNYGIYNSSSSPKISNVTVSVTGIGSADSRGIYNFSASSPIMFDLIITVSGGLTTRGIDNNTSSSPTIIGGLITASGASSLNVGIDNSTSSSSQMDGVSLVVSGGSSCFGVNSFNAQPRLHNVKIDASGGIVTSGVYSSGTSTIKIKFSSIKSTSNTIVANTGGSVYVILSHLNGQPPSGAGTVTCAGIDYKESGFIANACQ